MVNKSTKPFMVSLSNHEAPFDRLRANEAFLRLIVLPAVLLATALAACSSESPEPTATVAPPPTAVPTVAPTAVPTAIPTPTTVPTPTPVPVSKHMEGIRGIVDPTNLGWPREVEGLNGLVSIPAKPERIITASIGHDEITVALVPKTRLVGVGNVSKNATYSNVASYVEDIDEISRDPETIVAKAPDVVVTSPFFPAEAIEALSKTGIPVIQTELKHDPEARISSILFMGYIFGEEERAIEFADEVRERHDSLTAVTGKAEPKPRVLALTQYSDKLWTAGGNSTEGGVITAAGGINAAEEAGIEGNQTTSLEGVIAMTPRSSSSPSPPSSAARSSGKACSTTRPSPSFRQSRITKCIWSMASTSPRCRTGTSVGPRTSPGFSGRRSSRSRPTSPSAWPSSTT